jgi:hypothetical protein
MVTYTEGVGILMGMIINFPQDFLAKELAALMINLSYNARICESMIANRGLNLLMDRFSDKRDPLLMKIIRNISLWTFNLQQEQENPELSHKFRGLWSPHIKILVEIMLEEDNHDLIVEVFSNSRVFTDMTDLCDFSSNWLFICVDFGLPSKHDGIRFTIDIQLVKTIARIQFDKLFFKVFGARNGAKRCGVRNYYVDWINCD